MRGTHPGTARPQSRPTVAGGVRPRREPGGHRRRARGPVTAAVALAGSLALAVVLGGCALSLQSLPKVSGVGTATYPMHAVFANVLNLPDDAQVRGAPRWSAKSAPSPRVTSRPI